MNTMPDPEETEREALADLIEATSTEWEADFKAEGIRIGNHADFVANRLIASGFRRLSESEIRRDQAEKIESLLTGGPYTDEPEGHGSEVSPITVALSYIRSQFPTPSPETEQEPRFLYARCDGSGRCSALYHVHGCFTEHGRDACDTPDAHDSGETE